jgi:transglutaminase-like putative cysteine protease
MIRRWLVLLSWTLAAASSAADVPAWLREAAAQPHPAYPPQTKAVVLLHEEKVLVEASGKQTTTTRMAIKVLTLEGKAEAGAGKAFDSKDSKVREMKAWLIQPTGKTREFGKKDIIEQSLNSDELYSALRYAGAAATSEIDPGGVFGFESVLEEKRVFSQYTFSFQDLRPHLFSRFQVTVPPGWKAEAKGYAGAPAQPRVSGETFTWEARDLPLIEREPGAPALSSLAPTIRVSLVPPAGETSSALATFAAWPDLSQWLSRLGEAAAEVTPAVEAQAKALLSGKTTAWERVRAVAEFAQGIRYVAISTNLSKGGGYVPHSADQVLAKRYGDCKDKANLMKALLRVAGIESWLVTIYSGDPYFTQPDWPSPHQFNHAILAIAMPDAPASPATLVHPQLGRLLLFDPTDEAVPLGYLPVHEQGAYALVLAGARGDLLKMPQSAPEQNHTERRWDITLDADGSITGTLEEISTGQDAFDAGELDRQLAQGKNQQITQYRMNRAMPGVELRDVVRNYDPATRRHRLTLGFRAPGYARVMKGKLWMVKGVPMTYDAMPNVNRPERVQSLVVPPTSFSESIAWHLPERLTVDELPDSVSGKNDWGSFQTEWKQSARQIQVQRSLVLRPGLVSPASYQPTRKFLMSFNGAEVAPFVLLAP